MNIIIYTAIFGDYNILRMPKVINKKIKYICFTDKKINCPPWEIIKVVPESVDFTRENRKYKILSHVCLKNYNYDISIYLDGNYTILRDFSFYSEKWLGKNDIAVMKNPHRNCIYEEAKACIIQKKDDINLFKKQIRSYKNEGYPKNNGLTDNSLIIRRNTNKVKEFNELWWSELKKFSRRDQISFKYVQYKLNTNISIIPLPNPRIYKNKFFKLRKNIKKIDKLFVIQEIINKINAQIYLEIGGSIHNNFLKIKAPQKVKIFINLFKNITMDNIRRYFHLFGYIIYDLIKNKLNALNRYFFLKKQNIFDKKQRIFIKYGLDVVFINHVDSYQTSLKYIFNSIRFLKKKGIIIFNYCNPLSKEFYLENKKSNKFFKLNLNYNLKRNKRDNWKAIIYLRSKFQNLNVFVLNVESGLGIISRGKVKEKLNYSIDEIKNLTYNDLKKNPEKLINLKNPYYIKKFINEIY